MDPLEQYRDLRLDLADTLRAQVHLARERHDTILEQAVRDLLTRLARDSFTVAVAGQFSRGKTTLLNALLGAEYLPTGALPLTSVLTRISYASAGAATYQRRGSDAVIPVPIGDVPDLVARQSARRSELQVTAVDIRLPAELLRLGVTFVDTPGVGGIDAATSAITLGFLPDADAVVFVTSADSALNDTDLTLLDRFPPTAHVFCVVNKRDLVTPDEVEEVAATMRSTLAARRPAGSTEVFTLSALQGLRAAQSARPQLDDGGVGAFRSRLTVFLTRSRMPVALAAIRDRAEPLARGQHALLDLADQHTTAPPLDRNATDALVADARAETSRAQANIVARIRSRINTLISTLSNDPAWAVPEDVLLEATDAELDAFLDARAGRLTEEVVRAASPELAELAASSTVPMRTALSHVLGGATGAITKPWDPASLSPVAPPRLHRPPAEETEARHSRRNDRRAAEHRQQQAGRLVAAERNQSVARLEDWTQTLQHQTKRRAEDETARLDTYLKEPVAPDQFDMISRIERRLTEIGATLAAIPLDLDTSTASDEPGSTVMTGGGDHLERRCVVCARQRNALIDDITHRQYLLATREAEQEALAGAHGLCPAHTWSYASTSSPLGISAAYAPLAEVAADTLRTTDWETLTRSAVTLSTGPSSCPVCELVAHAERAAIGDLRPGDTVCVLHLARATALGTDRALIRALAARLAETLTRDAQDMRGYALKREAYTRGLVTAEESRAHREALLLLAGDPALAQPLVNEQEHDELSFS